MAHNWLPTTHAVECWGHLGESKPKRRLWKSILGCSGCLTVSQFQKARSLVSGRLVDLIVVVVWQRHNFEHTKLWGFAKNQFRAATQSLESCGQSIAFISYSSRMTSCSACLVRPMNFDDESRACHAIPTNQPNLSICTTEIWPCHDAEQDSRWRHHYLHT